MAVRDTYSDTARLGQAGPGRNEYLVQQDFGISTIADENANGGWRKTDLPVGGPAPRDKFTYGSAGQEDMMDCNMPGMG